MRKRWLAWSATLALVGLAACQSPPVALPAAGSAGVQRVAVTPHAGGTISLRIGPAGMRTQGPHKTFNDVTKLTVKLVRKADDVVVASVDPVAPNVAGSNVVFNNVATGFVYYLAVDAFEGATSIAKTSPTKSADISVMTASTHTVNMTLPLKDGFGGTLNLAFTTPAYFTATNYLIWVVNAATGAVVTSYKSSTASPSLTALVDGNYNVWTAAVDDVGGLMTPARMVGAVTVAGDTVTAPVGGTLNVTFPGTITQMADLPGTDLVALAVDGAGAAYATDSLSAKVKKVATPGGAVTDVVGNGSAGSGNDGDPANGSVISPVGGVANGLAVDSNGHLFIGDFTNARLRMVPAVNVLAPLFNFPTMNANSIYTLRTVVAGPKGVAVDSTGNVYYTDNRTLTKLATNDTVTTYTTLSSSPNGLAVDRFGNLYASKQTVVHMYVNTPGTYFGTAMAAGLQTVPNLPAGTWRGVAVDAVGNLYAAENTNASVVVVNSLNGTVYRVLGTGADGVAISDGGNPTSGALSGIIGLAVTNAGSLYCTTTSAVWRYP